MSYNSIQSIHIIDFKRGALFRKLSLCYDHTIIQYWRLSAAEERTENAEKTYKTRH